MRNRLQDARVDLDLTQQQLAERAGVSVFTIIRAENGTIPMPLQQGRISKALGLTRESLWPHQDEVSA